MSRSDVRRGPGHLSGIASCFAAASMLSLAASPASGQVEFWMLEGRPYFDPPAAGVREANVAALALAWADRVAFQVEPDDPRRVWDIDLGVEMPLMGWQSGPSDRGRPIAGGWGVGLWIPVDWHMIEDFVDDSAPIIDTDYRFGLAIKAQKNLGGGERWLSARVYGGHESTHLGDEFSVVGQREFPGTFERINVSWEFVDVALAFEAAALAGLLRAYGGATRLVGEGGYYGVDSNSITESAIGPVTPSTNRTDPYGGLEMRWEEVFGGSVGWGVFAGAELRWRSIYDYHKADPEAEEDRQASINVIAGISRTGSVAGLGRVAPYVRVYRGVNPFGQFRNQPDFTLYGVGLRLFR